MLTYEKVLGVFREHLPADGSYDVVMTCHGYTVLDWDAEREEWTSVQLCPTPEALRDELLKNYEGFLESILTDEGNHDLTEEEEQEIQEKCQALLEKLPSD